MELLIVEEHEAICPRESRRITEQAICVSRAKVIGHLQSRQQKGAMANFACQKFSTHTSLDKEEAGVGQGMKDMRLELPEDSRPADKWSAVTLSNDSSRNNWP